MKAIKEQQSMPSINSLPGLLLTLTALSGELPAALMGQMPSTPAYRKKVVKSLKRKQLLYTFYKNGLRGLRLTASAKIMLLNDHPDWFRSYLTGPVETNQVKCEITRRIRLHRMAEVLVVMYTAGVPVFPWEKPAVFQPVPPRDDTVRLPAYFSSREIKEIGPQASMIRGSRSTGVLLADGGFFVVYNTGPAQMKWEYKAEMRFKALLQTEICRQRLSAQFMDVDVDAIVFGADMERLETMMGAYDGTSHNYFILDGGFEHFYFLTCDHKGEALIRLLYNGELRSTLDEILADGLYPPNPDLPVENDALDGDTPVLFGYLCDMPRLRRFDNALSIYEREGVVICFDFQEEMYRRCLSPYVQLQCLDFEACERSVFPSPEKKS